MSVRFAWPICNRPAGDYNVVAGSVCAGRPFRQPLSLPDAANFSDGLELWLEAGSDAAHIFACFDGYISFHAASAIQPNRLKLNSTNNVSSHLRRLNTVEPLSTSFIYGNVDRQVVRQALIDLITTSFAAATGAMNTWHSVMRDFRWGGLHLRHFIALTAAANRAALIEEVVDNCLNNSAVDGNARLPVMAGDRLGQPADAFGSAVPPAGCPFAAAVQPPLHLIFSIEERGGQVRNPLYDFWNWLNNSTGVNPPIRLLAPHNIGSANPHPIALLAGLNLAPPKPPPRIDSATSLRPIPMRDLTNFHHQDNARVEWRFTNNGILESQLRPGEPGPNANVNPPLQQYVRLVNRMWGLAPSAPGLANDIVHMSLAFQVPCELIIAFLGKETTNLNERAVRFEPVNNNERQRVDAVLLANPSYLNLANLYTAVIGNDGFSTNVLNPWNGAAIIRAVGTDQMSWADMAQLLDLSSYFRGRVSPGLMQTVISTTERVINWIQLIFPDINDTYPIAGGPHNWLTYFGIAQLPANPSGYLTDWLLIPRHCIMVGTAYIRQLYNLNPICHSWDPPLVAATYNAGSVRGPFDKCPKYPYPLAGTPEHNQRRTWGLCYAGDYMTRYGQVYNAAVNLFNGNPAIAPAPPVRIRS